MKIREQLECAHQDVERLNSDVLCANERAEMYREQLIGVREQFSKADEEKTVMLSKLEEEIMRCNEHLEENSRVAEQLAADLDCAKECEQMSREQLSKVKGQLSVAEEEKAALLSESEERRMKMNEQLEYAHRDVERLTADVTCANERAEMNCKRLSKVREDIARGNDLAETYRAQLSRATEAKEEYSKSEERSMMKLCEQLEQAHRNVERLSADFFCADEQADMYRERLDKTEGGGDKEPVRQHQVQILVEENLALRQRIAQLEEENEMMDEEMEHLVDEMENMDEDFDRAKTFKGNGHEGESVEFCIGDDGEDAGSLFAESLTADPADVVILDDDDEDDNNNDDGSSARLDVDRKKEGAKLIVHLRRELNELRANVARLTRERDEAIDDTRRVSLELSKLKPKKQLPGLEELSMMRQDSLTQTTLAVSFESFPSDHTIGSYETLLSERDGLRRELDEVRAVLACLEKEKEKATAKSNALEESMASIQSRNESLLADLIASESKVEDLKDHLAKANNEVDVTRCECEESRAALSNMKSEYDVLAYRMGEYKREKHRLEVEKKEAVSKSNDLERSLAKLQSHNQSSSEELNASKSKIKELQAQLDASLAELNFTIEQKTAEVNSTRLELEEVRGKSSSLKSAHDELALVLDNVRRDAVHLEMEKEGAVARATGLESTLAELQDDNKSLSADIFVYRSKSEGLQAHLSRLKSERDELASNLGMAKGDLERLKESAAASSNGLEDKLVELQCMNEILSADLDASKSKMNYVLDQNTDFGAIIEQKSDQVNAYKQTIATLEERIEQERKNTLKISNDHLMTIGRLEACTVDAESDRDNMCLELKKTQMSLSELASHLDKAKGDIARFMTEKEEVIVKSSDLQESHTAMHRRIKSLLADLNKSEPKNEDLQAELVESHTNNSHKTGELIAAKKETAALIKQVENLEELLDQEKENALESSNDRLVIISMMEERVACAEVDRDNFRLKMESERAALSTLKSDHDELVSQMGHDITLLAKEKEETVAKLNDLKDSLVQLQGRNNSLLAELDVTRLKNDELHAQLEANLSEENVTIEKKNSGRNSLHLASEDERVASSIQIVERGVIVSNLDKINAKSNPDKTEGHIVDDERKEVAVESNSLEDSVVELNDRNECLSAERGSFKSKNEYPQAQLIEAISNSFDEFITFVGADVPEGGQSDESVLPRSQELAKHEESKISAKQIYDHHIPIHSLYSHSRNISSRSMSECDSETIQSPLACANNNSQALAKQTAMNTDFSMESEVRHESSNVHGDISDDIVKVEVSPIKKSRRLSLIRLWSRSDQRRRSKKWH